VPHEHGFTTTKITADPAAGTVTFDCRIKATHKGHYEGVTAANKKVTRHGTTER
jgi:hypothetical protein